MLRLSVAQCNWSKLIRAFVTLQLALGGVQAKRTPAPEFCSRGDELGEEPEPLLPDSSSTIVFNHQKAQTAASPYPPAPLLRKNASENSGTDPKAFLRCLQCKGEVSEPQSPHRQLKKVT